MTARVVLGALAGIGVGLGLLLAFAALRPATAPGGVASGQRVPGRAAMRVRRDWPWQRIALAVGAGATVLVLTRWLAVAVALGVLAGCWRLLFGGARAARVSIARVEALAAWTESLRDLVATGVALPEAMPASASAAGAAIAEPLATLVDRLRAREPMEAALRAFADELDDVGADLVVAALLLNTRAQGRQLHAVLSALSASARAELAMRRRIEAERRSTRRGVQIVLVVTVAMALGLALLNPAYVAPYQSAVGQAVLAVVVALFVVGFGWLHRLAAIPVPGRFLRTSATEPAEAASLGPAAVTAGTRPW